MNHLERFYVDLAAAVMFVLSWEFIRKGGGR
jgi:hypothetical protein